MTILSNFRTVPRPQTWFVHWDITSSIFKSILRLCQKGYPNKVKFDDHDHDVVLLTVEEAPHTDGPGMNAGLDLPRFLPAPKRNENFGYC